MLVRSAHSREHQGAPRLLDRAVRPRRARWSCRPSTSRCTSARCRPRSPRCSARSTRRASRGSSTTRIAAAPTCPTSPSSRRPSPPAQLLGFAASRAHHADVGGAHAGLDAGRLAHARRGGRRDRAARARRRGDRRARGADAPARPAPRRPARPARRQPRRRRAAAPSWRSAWAADGLRAAIAAVLDYAERRTRACLAALPDGERAATRRARGPRRRPRAAPGARPSPATS